MNVGDKNVISILEEDTWISSNYLEEKKVDSAIDISDLLKKRYDFSIDVPSDQLGVVLQTEAEKENECIVESADLIMDGRNVSDDITTTICTPIWIVVNKKTRVNRKIRSVDTQMLGSAKLEITNAMSHLSDKFNSMTNDKIIELKSIEDTSVHNNISNTRNLPNILRGPKILSKSNTSSPISFEAEDNFLSTNNVLENDISEKETNSSTNKSHHKRKQIHNPLIIQEDLMNLTTDKKFNYYNKPTRKNKFDLRKTEKLTRNYRKVTDYKKKPFQYKKIRNKISFSPTPMEEVAVQNSSIDADIITSSQEKTKDQISDLNLSSEFDEFYKEQFHEDYTDHLDILKDALREYQDLNDNYAHECYDMNSNYIFNSNDMECSKLQYEDSQENNDKKQNEDLWDNTNIIENNCLSDYEDYLNHNNNKFLTSAKDLESAYISSSDSNSEKASINNLCNKNCLSSFLDDSSDDEFCLKNVSFNDLQNSVNKDEVRHLDTLLLGEKKCEANLENPLNSDLNSPKINFKLTNDTKNITPISLSNDLEHKTTIGQDESEQQRDQCNVLLNAESSANVSSDYPEYSEVNCTNVPEENHLPVQKYIQEDIEALNNYTVELNYEEKCDKHPLLVKSDESTTTDNNLTKINKPKIVIETLQCLLCGQTFPYRRSLALHIAGAHGGMYVILCDRCGRLFNKKCLFNRHFIHCGCVKMPFGCYKCNKTYRHKSSLLHHLKAVHQIEHKKDTTKLYKCNVCSKVYRKCGAFEKHLSMHINS